MARWIDADWLKKDIARLHTLNDEMEIRRAYAVNPHSTMTDFEETLVSVFDAIDEAPTIDAVPRDFHDKTCEAMAKRHLEELEKYRWIPCAERLPSEDGWYLIALLTEHGTLYLPAHWYRGRWLNVNEHEDAVWMPIPPYMGEKETDHE